MSPTESPDPTVVVDPAHDAAVAPWVLWTAPGSVGVEELQASWPQGVSALRSHRGPLAAVLVDRDGSTVLTTDPLGTLSLHWARNATGRIVVDTSISRIVDRPDVDDRLDLEGVAIAAMPGLRGTGGADRTAFREVRAVPPGTAVRFRPDGTWTHERYWSPELVDGPDERMSFGDCVEALREAIDAAVRRVVGDAPLGAHVSGGLDCTAVACRAQMVLAEQGRSLVAGYSWAPSEDEVPRFAGDERDLLDDVERATGVPVRRLEVRDTDWWHQRDPNRYPASTHGSERHVVQSAHDDGVEVMLSGWGGDELASFNGRGMWTPLIRRGAWRQVATEQRLQRTLRGIPESPLVAARELLSAAVRALPHPLDEGRHLLAARRQHRADLEWEAELRAFSPLVADLAAEQRRRFESVHDTRSYQEALLANGHLQHRMGAWQQVGDLFGVTYRYPLLDVGVVETALSLPWWAWRHDGWSRAAYRTAVSPWVPGSVAWNLRKVEPAFFRRPGAEPRPQEEPPADAWQSDDPDYDDVLQLARSRRRLNLRRNTAPDQRVETRPDRAL